MTELLVQAMDRAEALPPDMQDEIARIVLAYAGAGRAPVELTPDEEDAVMRSRAAAARGEFASDTQMEAIWSKHGL